MGKETDIIMEQYFKNKNASPARQMGFRLAMRVLCEERPEIVCPFMKGTSAYDAFSLGAEECSQYWDRLSKLATGGD